jgi:hypothetical protein
MIPLGQCEITGIFGPMASGKTYLISQWLKNQNRYVRFDATGETCEDAGVEHVWQSPAALHERLKANPYYFRIAYHPGPELEEDFNWCLKVLWRQDVYKLMVVDEFHEVCPVSETPKYVRTMLRYARHAHMGVIGASQRLADVHKLFTAGCRLVILYWTQEARDLDAVQDRWGRECADAVANLRPLIYNDQTKVTKQIPQCVVIPRGEKFKVFDFAKDAYVMGNGASDIGTESEDESESNSNVSEEQPDNADAGGDDESEDAPQP